MEEYNNPLVHHPLFQHQKQSLYSSNESSCSNIQHMNNKNAGENNNHVDFKMNNSTCTTGQRPISPNVVFNEEGLVVPKKLVNPCLESKERQDLHRELLFNQKAGKNVLDQKTELARALEQRELLKKNKAREAEKKLVRKSSFERKLEQQQLKISYAESEEKNNENKQTPEFFRIHAKICEKREQVA